MKNSHGPMYSLKPARHLKFEVEKEFLNCSFGGWEVGRSRFSIKKSMEMPRGGFHGNGVFIQCLGFLLISLGFIL